MCLNLPILTCQLIGIKYKESCHKPDRVREATSMMHGLSWGALCNITLPVVYSKFSWNMLVTF